MFSEGLKPPTRTVFAYKTDITGTCASVAGNSSGRVRHEKRGQGNEGAGAWQVKNYVRFFRYGEFTPKSLDVNQGCRNICVFIYIYIYIIHIMG